MDWRLSMAGLPGVTAPADNASFPVYSMEMDPFPVFVAVTAPRVPVAAEALT